MRKILIGLGVIVVVLLVVVVAAPFFIPTGQVKAWLEQEAERATGRKLTVAGDFSLSVLPRFEARAKGITLANAPGGVAPNMLAVEEIRIKVDPLPLLSGEVVVNEFVLVKPTISLEVAKDGRKNWQFASGTAAKPEAAPPASGGGKGGASISELRLGDVRLVDGTVSYTDARTGAKQQASAIDMTVSQPGLDSPFKADGSVTWNGKPIAIKLAAAKARDLIEGRQVPTTVGVSAETVKFDYDGTMVAAAPFKIAGKTTLNVPSVRNLAAWTGAPITGMGTGLGPLAIEGQVAATDADFAFEKAKVALDGMNATGDVRVDLKGAKPNIVARLDVDRIDLNKYQDPKPAAPAGGAPAAGGTPAKPGGWDDKPIDVAGLRGLNAQLAFATGALVMDEIKIGRTAINTTVRDGRLVVDMTEMALYDGKGTAKIQLDGSGQVPALDAAFALQGVQANPLLTDAADFKRLEGTGNAEVKVTASGRSQKDMVSHLNGNGKLQFLNGAIRGINLAAMVRNVESAFLKSGGEEKTDFAELGGTFRIANGILSNDDLALKAPLLRLDGKGTVDMPARTINYRIEPKVVGTLEGQGGKDQLSGVHVPVLITGSWDDPKYAPDLAAMITDQVKDKAMEQIQKNIPVPIPVPGQGGGANPADSLKKLFGR